MTSYTRHKLLGDPKWKYIEKPTEQTEIVMNVAFCGFCKVGGLDVETNRDRDRERP